MRPHFTDERYYVATNDEPSDLLRRQYEYQKSQQSFVLYNKLPVAVKVIHERVEPPSITTLGTVGKNETLTIQARQILSKDLLHFIYTAPSGKRYYACPSHEVALHLGDVIIGTVVSAQGGYNRDIHFNGDISSVRIHNMLPWPVYVSHNGRRAMYIDRNEFLGTKEHGDLLAVPSVYFDNSNMGLKINDLLKIEIDNRITPEIPIEWATFEVGDRYISEIFIGQNTTQVGSHIKPELYFYRLGTDNSKIRPKNDSNIKSIWPTQNTNKIPLKRYGVLNK